METIRSLFWNQQQGRLRALWRLLAAALLLLALLMSVGVALGLLALLGASGGMNQDSVGQLMEDPGLRALSALVGLVVISLGTWAAARRFDRRPFPDLGLHVDRAWWLDLGFGLFLGALLMIGIFIFEREVGWVRVTETLRPARASQPFLLALIPPLVTYVAIGIQEELLIRGYLLKNLAEGLNLPVLNPNVALLIAWLLSSLIFGLAHAGNPHASLVSTLNLSLAGLFLGLGYVLTGELALSIGLHITWNFFQGVVFGFPVSGLSPLTTFVAVEQGGPELWTGGAFGPEAGLVGILALLLGSLLTLGWVLRRRGRLALQSDVAEPPVNGGQV